MGSVKHFVLVHGFCHGAWCWYRLVTQLKLASHHATALDLAGGGINPKQLDEIVSVSVYLQPLMDFMASLPRDEKVILVGHSYGGLPISLAMEAFPEKILGAVFVTAYMPNHKDRPATLIQEFFKRTSIESLMDCQFTFDGGPENLPTSAIFGPNYMATNMYQHCHPEDLELAKMLVRPSKFFIEDMAKESLLTKEKYGSVSRAYIICEEDEVMKEDFARWMIEYSPPKEKKYTAGTPPKAWKDTQFLTFGDPKEPTTGLVVGPQFLKSTIYDLCSPEDYTLGTLLVRPGSLFMEDLHKADKFTDEVFGSVPRVYVVCDEDKTNSSSG
ncbi:hypothetical protein F0562_006521 [Nyssa sinensis]|uniref:AB hydrolase-1 domain-containing protein n=1 Tax=Nyssa sinensis TaxID=561372 RepID=A0A5J5APT0_9ASTE|nr:hypothetical protein F0562_006521 [Nyssa sinensis]